MEFCYLAKVTDIPNNMRVVDNFIDRLLVGLLLYDLIKINTRF